MSHLEEIIWLKHAIHLEKNGHIDVPKKSLSHSGVWGVIHIKCIHELWSLLYDIP
jgi:hypothetical protein